MCPGSCCFREALPLSDLAPPLAADSASMLLFFYLHTQTMVVSRSPSFRPDGGKAAPKSQWETLASCDDAPSGGKASLPSLLFQPKTRPSNLSSRQFDAWRTWVWYSDTRVLRQPEHGRHGRWPWRSRCHDLGSFGPLVVRDLPATDHGIVISVRWEPCCSECHCIHIPYLAYLAVSLACCSSTPPPLSLLTCGRRLDARRRERAS